MFDFKNHSEAISTEHIYTDYYLNYEISINKTNVNRNASDHAIHVNKHNHSMKQTSNDIYRLKRFLAFLSFFILFLLLITILSKLYACLTKMKLRKKRYGFYLNYKMEKIIDDWRNKIKYKKLKIEAKFEPKQQLVINIYSKDFGHVNESFDPNNELIMIDDNNNNTQKIITTRNKQTNFLSKYLETKRINSFEYEKFKNEDDDFTSVQEDNKEYNIMMKLFKRSKLKHDKSIPLFTFSNEKKKFLNDLTQSTSSFIYKNSSSSSNVTTSSFSTNSTISTTASTFDIPLILVTDTAKMQTNIIDLDTFEPENCRKTRLDILLKYKSNDQRPV